MKKAAARIMGSLAFLMGMGDIVASETVFRQMFGGVIIIMGILFFILGEVFEISEMVRGGGQEKRLDI